MNSIEATKHQVKQREIWLDVLKVIAAGLIVLLHNSGDIYNTTPDISSRTWVCGLALMSITRCAVPIFIMVSGALLIREDVAPQKCIRKAIIAFLVLEVWSMIYILLKGILWGFSGHTLRDMCMTLLAETPSGHLWYGYLLVWIYLFTPIIAKLYYALGATLRKYMILIALLIPSIIEWGIDFLEIAVGSKPVMSYYPYMTLVYVAIMIFGKMIYDGEIHMTRSQAICVMIAGFAITIASALLSSMGHEEPDGAFFSETAIGNILYAAGLMMAAKEICGTTRKKRNYESPRVITSIAKVSLGVYYANSAVCWILGTCLSNKGLPTYASGGIYAIVFSVIAYSITVGAVLIGSHIPIINKLVR